MIAHTLSPHYEASGLFACSRHRDSSSKLMFAGMDIGGSPDAFCQHLQPTLAFAFVCVQTFQNDGNILPPQTSLPHPPTPPPLTTATRHITAQKQQTASKAPKVPGLLPACFLLKVCGNWNEHQNPLHKAFGRHGAHEVKGLVSKWGRPQSGGCPSGFTLKRRAIFSGIRELFLIFLWAGCLSFAAFCEFSGRLVAFARTHPLINKSSLNQLNIP